MTKQNSEERLACLLYDHLVGSVGASREIAHAVANLIDDTIQVPLPPGVGGFPPPWPGSSGGPGFTPPYPTASDGPPSLTSGAMAVIVAYALGMASGAFLTMVVWGIFW